MNRITLVHHAPATALYCGTRAATLNQSAPSLDDQSERSHATTADAAKKVIFNLGHCEI
jgi:hypothetical protein